MSDAEDELDDAPAIGGAPDPALRSRAWLECLAVTLLSGVALTVAFSDALAESPLMLPIVGGAYAVLGVATLIYLHKKGRLREELAPRRLDVTLGALVALVLVLGAMVTELGLQQRAIGGWMFQLFLQLGDPRGTASAWLGPAVFATALLEELVWRGFVMRRLAEAEGARRALWCSTLLYAMAHAGTVYTLRDPNVGPNPLLVLAAAGCGLVWGLLAVRFDRLVPSLAAHAIFSWAVVLFPVWRL